MAQKVKTPWPGGGPTGGMPPNIVWVIASMVGLVISAAGLFAAGYFTHDLVTDDDGGTAVVAQPSAPAGTPSAQPTAVPPSVVEVSTDDAPSWGPADAEVTVVEFSDYQ